MLKFITSIFYGAFCLAFYKAGIKNNSEIIAVKYPVLTCLISY